MILTQYIVYLIQLLCLLAKLQTVQSGVNSVDIRFSREKLIILHAYHLGVHSVKINTVKTLSGWVVLWTLHVWYNQI